MSAYALPPPPNNDPEFTGDPDLHFVRPELVEILGYWSGKRSGRKFPSRADIAPRDLGKLLPWIAKWDVEAGAGDGFIFRNRLLGTALAKLLAPVDWRGKILSEQQGVLFERLQWSLEWVARARAPFRTLGLLAALPGQKFHSNETCYLPLSENGHDVSIIMILVMLGNIK